LGISTHALTASFSGATGFADSASAAVAVTVNPAATAVTLKSSVNPAVTGQAVTFTATVAAVAPGASTPTGTVRFQDGNVILGTVAVGAGGTATFTTSFAVAGGHTITAVYSGAPNFVASSQALTEQVNAATTRKATTTGLLASANPARVGQLVTLTATVRDPSGTGTPTGTITFFVGNTLVARVTLDRNGQAHIRGSFSVAGRFIIRAVYSGDATFGASEQSFTEQVNA
jgi:Bacterial Ig-like domain (group 3)